MSEHCGMPGPGGSLGQCAICGQNFLKEVLLGVTVPSFSQAGINQTLYAHKECLKKAEKMTDWRELPDGPLRHAIASTWEQAV